MCKERGPVQGEGAVPRARKFCEELMAPKQPQMMAGSGGCGLALISSLGPEPALLNFKLVCQEQSKFLLCLSSQSIFPALLYQAL